MSPLQQRCVYCSQFITADDDAQRVSKREVAHTACAFAVNDAFFAALDAEEARNIEMRVEDDLC